MKLPTPETSGANSSSLPFLKPKDIQAKGKTKITVIGNVREGNSQFGDGINVDVRVGNKQFTFTIKFESGNYRRLYENLGSNPDKWGKKSFFAQRAEYLGKSYVQVCD